MASRRIATDGHGEVMHFVEASTPLLSTPRCQDLSPQGRMAGSPCRGCFARRQRNRLDQEFGARQVRGDAIGSFPATPTLVIFFRTICCRLQGAVARRWRAVRSGCRLPRAGSTTAKCIMCRTLDDAAACRELSRSLSSAELRIGHFRERRKPPVPYVSVPVSRRAATGSGITELAQCIGEPGAQA